MCIRIIHENEEVKYDSSRPLEEQLLGSKSIIVTYDSKDSDIDVFVGEVERLCKTGVCLDTNVKVIHNNHLKGAKAKKLMERLSKDLELNEAIKILVTMQSEMNKKLEKLSSFCTNR